jgi:hypothetical protein
MYALLINPAAVFEMIQENLVTLRGIDYQQLSKVEEELQRELLEVRELALSIKIRWKHEGLGRRTTIKATTVARQQVQLVTSRTVSQIEVCALAAWCTSGQMFFKG